MYIDINISGEAAMANGRTWAIKGVEDRTRDAVYEATRADGLTLGEWIDRALAKAAEEALHPKPAAATRADVAELIAARLGPIGAALGRIAERLAALEEKADRRTGPTAARTGTRGKHPRGSRLRLPGT